MFLSDTMPDLIRVDDACDTASAVGIRADYEDWRMVCDFHFPPRSDALGVDDGMAARTADCANHPVAELGGLAELLADAANDPGEADSAYRRFCVSSSGLLESEETFEDLEQEIAELASAIEHRQLQKRVAGEEEDGFADDCFEGYPITDLESWLDHVDTTMGMVLRLEELENEFASGWPDARLPGQ